MKKLNQNDIQSTSSNYAQRKRLGNQGEQATIEHLQREGFHILDHNYYKKCGEIDIIARKDEVIAFVEVKLRSNHYFNTSEVINFSKQKKIIATARYYLLEHNLVDIVIRFDVALVSLAEGSSSISYIQNAFTQKSGF
jgi:putative endonuclease